MPYPYDDEAPDAADQLDAIAAGATARPMPANAFDAALSGAPLPGETGEGFMARRRKLGEMGVLGPADLPRDEREEAMNRQQAAGARDDASRALNQQGAAMQREEARAAKAAEVERAKQEREAATEAKRNQAVANRRMKDAGMVLEMGEDGVERPAKHGDGRLKWKPEFTGDAYFDADSGRWVRDYRDAYGSTKAVDMEQNGDLHTDAETGERYFKGPDGLRVNLGPDATFEKRKEIQARVADLQAADESLMLDLRERDLQLAPLKSALDEASGPWKAAKKKHDEFAAMAANFGTPETQAALARAKADLDKATPAYDAAKKAHDEAAGGVDAIKRQRIEKQRETLKLKTDLDRLKAARWLPEGAAKPLEHRAMDAAAAAQAELKAAQEAHAEVLRGVNGALAGAKQVTAAGAKEIEASAKAAVQESAGAVKSAAAKVVQLNKLGQEAKAATSALETVTSAAAKAADEITRQQQLIFAQRIEGALTPEEAERRSAELEKRREAALAPVKVAAEKRKAAVAAVADAFTDPEKWEQSAERGIALADVEKEIAEQEANGVQAGEAAAKVLEKAKAAGIAKVEGADIDAELAKLREVAKAKGGSAWSNVEKLVGLVTDERERAKKSAAEVEAGLSSMADALVKQREAGKETAYFHYGDLPNTSAGMVFAGAVDRWEADQRDPNKSWLSKKLLGALRLTEGVLGSAFALAAGQTVADATRQAEAAEAARLTGRLDVNGVKEMLRAYPEIERRMKETGSVLTPEQRAKAASEGPARTFSGGGEGNVRFMEGGALVAANRTLAGAEQMIRELEAGRLGGMGDAAMAAFIESIPGFSAGNIEIDETSPVEVAQRNILRERLEAALEKHAPNLRLAGSATGSLAGFMGAGMLGESAKAGLTGAGIARGAGVARGATIMGVMGGGQSIKDKPGDVGALNRAADIGLKGGTLLLSERLGDAFGEKMAGIFARRIGRPAVGRFVGRAAGGGTGEVVSDLAQNAMEGRDSLANLDETLAVNYSLGLGMAIVGAMADARGRKIGGKPLAGNVEGAHGRMVEAARMLDEARQKGDVAAVAAATDAVAAATAGFDDAVRAGFAVSPKTRRTLAAALGAETASIETALEENPALRVAGVALGRELRDVYLPGNRFEGARRTVAAETDFDGVAQGMADAVVDQSVGALVARDLATVAQGNGNLSDAKIAGLGRLGLVVTAPDGGVTITDDALPFLPAALRKAIAADDGGTKFRVTVTPGNDGRLFNGLVEQGSGVLVAAAKAVTAKQAEAVQQMQGQTPNVQPPASSAQPAAGKWRVRVEAEQAERGIVRQTFEVSADSKEEAERIGRERAERMGDGRVVKTASAEEVAAPAETSNVQRPTSNKPANENTTAPQQQGKAADSDGKPSAPAAKTGAGAGDKATGGGAVAGDEVAAEQARIVAEVRRIVGEALAKEKGALAFGALNVRVNNGGKATAGGIFEARAKENGGAVTYELVIDHEAAGRLLAGKMVADLEGYVRASLREELIHFAQYEALKQRWEAEGRPGSYTEFKEGWYRELFAELEKSEAGRAVLEGARKLYGQKLESWALTAEGVRQMVQLARDGHVTEGMLRKLADALRKVVELLRGIAKNPAKVSPLLEQSIAETQAILDLAERGAKVAAAKAAPHSEHAGRAVEVAGADGAVKVPDAQKALIQSDRALRVLGGVLDCLRAKAA